MKEIAHFEIVKTMFLGSGTFGSCYLTHYRGMVVTVKKFHQRRSTDEGQVNEDVLCEAAIISRLGDHPGLPLLLGICTQTMPYRLVAQLHGEKKKSLTLWRAIKKVKLDKRCWFAILRAISKTLACIHEMGFLHDDLKSNNVVMERRGEATL